MKLFHKTLIILFGISISIEQGFTMVLGRLQNGQLIGPDVVMPVDILCYALLLFKPYKHVHTRSKWMITFGITLSVLYLFWSFLGEFISYDPAAFRFGFVHLARAVLVFITILTRIQTREDVINFTKGIMYSLGIQAIIGVWQWQIGAINIPFFKMNYSWRVSGTLRVANALGAFTAALTPLAIRLALFTKVKPRWLWMIIAVFSIGTLYATYTRGAWISFVVSMTLFFIIDFYKAKLTKRDLLILLLSLSVGIVLVNIKYGDAIQNRMSGAEESLRGDKGHSRLNMARDAIDIIRKNPVFGVGLNNYRFHADPSIQGTRIVHNTYLLITAQQGIIGIALFIILHITFFYKGFKIIHTKDKTLYHIGMATLTGMTSQFIYFLVAPDYRLVPVKLQHWRLLATLAVVIIANHEYQILLQIKKQKKKISHQGIPGKMLQPNGNFAKKY